MPTYQYACTECGHQLEAVQSFSDPALSECPNCEGKLRKVFNSVGIVFKGSGFYRTDSRAAQKDSEAAKASPNGSDAKKPDSAPSADPSGDKSGKSDKKASEKVSSGSSSSSSGSSSSSSSGSKVA